METFESCIGAGQIEGWFCHSSSENEKRGFGHVTSYSFEGQLFFHLQRSPWLRGVKYSRRDPVLFEVVEFNGRCEAVKLGLPQTEDADAKPEASELLGQTLEGRMTSHWHVVKSQSWGLVESDYFKGSVFWHMSDNPGMNDIQFERGDVVEFELYIHSARGQQVRARNLLFIRAADKEPERPPSPKREKKRRWLANWRKGPPPDWNCKSCGFHNFGRNRNCLGCGYPRPPREEWPAEEDEADEAAGTADMSPVQAQAFAPAELQSEQVWPSMQQPWTWPEPAIEHIEQFEHFEHSSQPPQLEAPAPNVDPESPAAQALSAFQNIIGSGRPAEDLIAEVKQCLDEAVKAFGDDRAARQAKQAFAVQLARHPWFAQTGYEVRFRPAAGTVELGLSAAARALKRKAQF
ncbi:unnamed protein product [Effrenium voratum]|uniref:RanBP2-type domain-containing protein n=1 Tax=Effrenium voratum TaxID=2562239 RepID=A0AA36JC29_9DINO|nr:unnamed protein product [Effrenium voratum]